MDATAPSFRSNGKSSAFATLRKFAVPRPEARAAAVKERCELCSVELAPEHRHLFETDTRKIICSCDACAFRFENVLEGRFKLIPRDVYALTDFRLDDMAWESLSLPINLAFFFNDSRSGRVMAQYPSPAGATESLLPLPAWESVVADNPVLANMAADTEALLVNRVKEARLYYIVPIDVCFELVGLIRIHWRGFTGGEEVWREVDDYFERLAARARPKSSQEIVHA
jgi:hypothetical protein